MPEAGRRSGRDIDPVGGYQQFVMFGWEIGARIYYSLDVFPLDQLKKNIGTPKMWF